VPLSLVRNPNQFAARKDPASEAKDHVNAETIVSGKLLNCIKLKSWYGSIWTSQFPNQPFTAVIFANKQIFFGLTSSRQDNRGQRQDY